MDATQQSAILEEDSNIESSNQINRAFVIGRPPG